MYPLRSQFRKYALLASALALALVSAARADYNPIVITTNSYNADMVVEKGASNLVFNNYATATFDNGTNNTGDTLFEYGFYLGQSNAIAGYTPGLGPIPNGGVGVPPHGSTFSSQDGSGRVFQMPPDYTQNNAVLVYSGIPSATITISSNAGPFQNLTFLNTGGGGPNTVTVIVNHVGGNSETNTISIGDWFSGTSGVVADYLHARVNIANNGNANIQNINFGNNTSAPRLYYNDLGLSDQTDPITSITFQNNGGNRNAIFAISGFNGVSWSPIGISGFNRDMIVEATALHQGDLMNHTSVTMDNGTNNNGNTFYEIGFDHNATATGIPAHGSTLTLGTASYLMPPDYTTNCVMYIGSPGMATGTLTFSNAVASATGLSILCAAGNGPANINYTINHQNDAPETGSIGVQDWFTTGAGFSNAVYSTGGRFQTDTLGFNNINNARPANSTPTLHTNNIPVTDPDPVVSVSFSYVGGGRAFILAVSPTTDGVTFTANGVSGWNADGVVEATAIWPNQTLGAGPVTFIGSGVTTATMDGGVANTGNTWFERGLDRAFPNSGLPPAGSTITSVAQADHHYTFAPSYSAKNAIFIDRTNFPSASIAIQPPYVTYSAFSFLSTAANGGTTNQIILQHLDGTSETNVFVSLDWFNNTPFAFSSVGRLNESIATLNSDTGGPNPRLYEAQFALNNIGSPVTNFIVSYLSSVNVANSNSARAAIFAVSALAGAVPPIVANPSPATFTGLEGTNLVLHSGVTGGSTNGLAYQWIYSPDNINWSSLANGTNLTIGGNFFGVTTTNLVLTNLVYTDSGFYAMVGQNVAGTVTSGVAQITLFSGLPDVCTPGDPIVAYQPAGGSSPAAETVDHAIDGLVGADPGKYLNFGVNNGQPFVGPVGFITTPSIGSTVISAVRLFTANDTQGRDPADVEIDGSNDGGVTFTPILPDTALNLPAARNALASAPANPLTQAFQELHFSNAAGYTTYRVVITNVETPATVNSMQIGEIQLLGVLNPTPPIISVQPPASIVVYTNTSPSFTISAHGFPSNLTYQWYLNGTTPIPGATSATLQLSHVTLAMSGNQYNCVVSNSVGGTPSTSATLTVTNPPSGSYINQILADNPSSYFRLDEGPDDGAGDNGVVGVDYAGGHNGVYTNAILGEAGYNSHDPDTAVFFGQFSLSQSFLGAISGVNFGASSNQDGAFSVECWANGFSGLSAVGQINGAGVVAKGYGGGGEQFAIDTGASGGNAYRFFVRDASGATYNAVSGITNTADGLWHHLVGVCDGAHSNVLLYIDGQLDGRATLLPGKGILNTFAATSFPVSIGARTSGQGVPYTNQFVGEIDEVALYSYALTPSQIVAHYDAALVPPIITTSPASQTVSAGSTVTLTSVEIGTPPLSIQWYVSTDGGSTFNAIGGQTSSNLVLVNVSGSLNGNQYQVRASNPYGGPVSSANATLTVISGPPQVLVDLASNYVVYPGSPITLTASVDGSLPITYGWWHNGAPLSDGGHYSGSHSNALTISDVLIANGGTYQLFATNSFGNTNSILANLSLLPTSVGFFTNGANWTGNQSGTFTVPIFPGSNVLELTDFGGSEGRSAFFNSQVYIGGFQATYTYAQNNTTAGADGVAFVVQDDPRGPAAIAGAGGNLAYAGAAPVGIIPSAAIAYNIYSGNGVGGIGAEFCQNGVLGPVFPTGGVSLSAGDNILTTVRYLNGVLTLTMTDTNLSASFTTNVPINLPALLGTNVAYVGFTGADGGSVATQTISDFAFTPLVAVTTQVAGNSLTLTWPAGTGGYVLQQNSVVNGTSAWSNSPAAVTQVNGQNQVTVPLTSAVQFYRLILPAGQ